MRLAQKKFQMVLSHKIGSELIVNGSFDTDSDWTLATRWSISGGTNAICNANGKGNLTAGTDRTGVYKPNTGNNRINIYS